MVEISPSEDLYDNPIQTYTQILLSAVPVPDPDLERTRERIEVKGELPSPIDPPSGCVFRTRCPFAQDICSQERPKLKSITQVISFTVICLMMNLNIYFLKI